MLNNKTNINLDTLIPLSEFIYIRFHSSLDLYIGSHSEIIPKFITFIRKMYDYNIKKIYVYFNNMDAATNELKLPDAIYDANLMKQLLKY